MLYAGNGALKGTISAPYILNGNANVINEFLITVSNTHGNTHYLEPKLESDGFINGMGIRTPSLYTDSSYDGEIQIQLYKANSSENRKALLDRQKKDVARQQGVDTSITNLNIPQPDLAGLF